MGTAYIGVFVGVAEPIGYETAVRDTSLPRRCEAQVSHYHVSKPMLTLGYINDGYETFGGGAHGQHGTRKTDRIRAS